MLSLSSIDPEPGKADEAALTCGSQRMKASSAMALSSTLGCLFVITMWGSGGGIGLAVLAPFAIVFGVFTGGFTSMWSQSAYNIAGPDKEQQTMLFSGELKAGSLLNHRTSPRYMCMCMCFNNTCYSDSD
jgi:hypothetical protein